jgi:signal transduction histidine kinase
LYQLIESAKADLSPGRITINNQVQEELEVYADPIIRKVFTTLIENAIRHGGNIEIIQFSCFEQKDTLFIICEDDGVGIPTPEKKYIFDHGFGKHTGIGLFLAREILSITGLSIRECGLPGKGARFEIDVPAGKYRFYHSGVP